MRTARFVLNAFRAGKLLVLAACVAWSSGAGGGSQNTGGSGQGVGGSSYDGDTSPAYGATWTPEGEAIATMLETFIDTDSLSAATFHALAQQTVQACTDCKVQRLCKPDMLAAPARHT